MNIIVTGSEGFIGQHLCERLTKDGHNIVRIDRKLGLEAANIEKYINGVELVYHLAGQTSVFNNKKELVLYDNYFTFVRICDICKQHNVKLVYASSSCAYNTTSLYGLSKRFCEEYASIYNDNAIGVRLHNVYGNNQRKGTLLYNLLNEHTTIYNGGNNKRHFTYIDDAVEGLVLASMSNEKLFNCYNPEYVSVNQFINEIRKYRHITDVEYTDEIRKYDKEEQLVDKTIKNLPVVYKTIEEGIKSFLL